MLENKSGNISETRKDIEEKLLWTAYRNYALSNGTIPDPYGIPFLQIGDFAT